MSAFQSSRATVVCWHRWRQIGPILGIWPSIAVEELSAAVTANARTVRRNLQNLQNLRNLRTSEPPKPPKPPKPRQESFSA
jgi:hypothetical protein